ncbi:MAG: hypothetical protein ACK5N8_08760 [Alphaproteobacteria bacterium]
MLYKVIENEEVLIRVIDAVSRAEKTLIVVHSELDKSSVQPNQGYENVLKNLLRKEVAITRYFHGSKEQFEAHKKAHVGVEYVLQRDDKFYQRAIIIDNEKAFFKIGNQFCYTEYMPLVEVLQNFLKE